MKEEQEISPDGLIDPVEEHVSTDAVADLKNGIYNLCVSLMHNLMITKGMEGAIVEMCDFLDEISINFKSTLTEQE